MAFDFLKKALNKTTEAVKASYDATAGAVKAS